jgi:hypothetical protein
MGGAELITDLAHVLDVLWKIMAVVGRLVHLY